MTNFVSQYTGLQIEDRLTKAGTAVQPEELTSLVGPQGPIGPTGPQGPQGVAGADGTSVALKGSVPTVGDLPASATQGDLYVVLASGDGYVWSGSAWANVGPIRGPQGETGATGATGPQGSKGDTGDVGPQGPAGVQGIQGETGPQGATGPKGDTGDTGSQGIQGIQGIQGPKGDTGATGATGPAGPGVAAGGTTGQMLVKASGADYDTQWVAAPTGDVTQTGTQTLSNKTLSSVKLDNGYTEEVFAVTGTTPALSPANGSIQTWTLTGNSAPTLGAWASGQSITLMVDDGTAYSIDWASMGVVWKTDGGTAPVLLTTGYTALALVNVGGTIYGWKAGDA